MSQGPVTEAPVFLTATWQRLLMLNYPIDPRDLARLVPRGTELDSWEGTTFVSLVAFQFLGTRIKGLAVPFHRDFEEINLRFYVRFRAPEGWRRGVVFVREVVPRRAIAAMARWLFNENYVACPTRSRIEDPTDGRAGRIEYGWKHRRAWLTLSATIAGDAASASVDSQEEFITEHYWGYSAQRDGGTVQYQVEHPSWNVWQATDSSVEGDVAGFYGAEFASALRGRPSSVFVADGSPVIVRGGQRLD